MITVTETSLNAQFDIEFAKNPIWFKLAAPSNWRTNDTYYIRCQIREESITGTLVVEFNLTPDANNEVLLEVQSYIADHLERLTFGTLPTVGQTSVNVLDYPKKYHIQFAEFVDNVEQTPDRTFIFNVLPSGFDYEAYNTQTPQSWIKNNGRFLSTAADPKRTTRNNDEFLYFVTGSSFAGVNFDVQVTLYYSDGTQTTYTAFSNIDHLNKLLQIPTSFDALNIEATAGNNLVVEYSVQLVENGTGAAVSEVFTYRVDLQPKSNPRQFWFKNSFGVYDVVHATGEQRIGINSKKEVLRRKLPYNYTVKDGGYLINNSESVRSHTGGTGFITQNDAESLQDFAIAEQYFEVKDGVAIPIIIEKLEENYDVKNGSLYGYVLEYRYAWDVNLYTPKALRETAPCWVATASGCDGPAPVGEAYLLDEEGNNLEWFDGESTICWTYKE